MKKILVILSVVCLFGSCNTPPFVIADGEKVAPVVVSEDD